MNERDVARFLAKVERRGPDECWPWTAGVDKDGYGRLKSSGKTLKAHRIAFFLAHGRWPEPFGCHSCDNPPCCNPEHVFEGSCQDNHSDMDRKGRRLNVTGASHGNTMLPDSAVLEIRAAAGRGRRQDLADKFGISYGHVWAIQKGICRASVV